MSDAAGYFGGQANRIAPDAGISGDFARVHKIDNITNIVKYDD